MGNADPLALFCQGNKSPEADRMYTHMLRRVYMTFPEKKVQSDARGWTREEISRLLAVA